MANDTLYGLGAGVWSRDMNTAYEMGRKIEAVEFGLIAITYILLMLHLAGTNNLALEGNS